MPAIVALCVSYVLSQFYRSFLAVLAPVLGNDLGMSPAELSYASGAWFVTFALAQFPIGIWLDGYGPRRTASYMHFLGAGLGIALFGFAQSPAHIIIAMGMIGIGCAPVLMSTFYVFAHNYSAAKFATLSSTFIAVGTLGNVAGSEPLAAAVETIGWRNTAFVLAAITFLTAVVIFFIVRDPVKETHDGERGSYLDVLKVKSLWLIFPVILFSYAVAGGIRGLWAGPLLQEVYGLSVLEIGRSTLFMALALVAGSLFYGPLDRIFGTRKWVGFGGNLAVFVVLLVFVFAMPKSASVATFLLVLIGFFGANYAVLMTHGKAFVPKHIIGRGVTMMNFFSIGGVGLMQYVAGFVYETAEDAGAPQDRYEILFSLYAITMAVALACYLFSSDAKPEKS